MVKGFKDFLLRGNVVDLAVVIGAVFGAVVTGFVNSFLKPLIGLVGGGGQLGGSFTVDGQRFTRGAFVSTVISFALTAAVIYFIVVVPMKRIIERRKRGEEAGPAAPSQVELLVEIRDLLRAQQGQRPAAAPSGPGTTSLPGQLGARRPQSLPQCGGRSSR
jgi:large conductance mechanosensitive channel